MRNASSSRREPHDHLKGFFKARGVTVIELMVFVAAAVILTSLALPPWNTVEEREQVIQGAHALAGFIGSARMDSVMRNRVVTVSYYRSGVDRWCFSVVEGADPCDCRISTPGGTAACEINASGRVFTHGSSGHPSIVDRLIGDGSFSFEPGSGALIDPDDKAEVVLISDRGRYSLSVHVESSGSVRVCSEHSGSQVPGFRLC